jgi:hypothetical protein
MTPSNAWAFAFLCALRTLFAYALWNLAVSGAPFWRPREAPAANSFRYVHSANHTRPRLPSVKDLADDIGDFYN